MEEIIHITPDLKHDPLAIKHFEEDVEFHMRSNNVKYENLLDLRNQEERPSELHKSYLHSQLRSWTPMS